MPPYNANDPTATFLSSSCLDLLLIELVPMAYRVTNELELASTAASASAASDIPPAAALTSSDSVSGTGTVGSVAVALGGSRQQQRVLDEDEERDAVFYRLETLGYRVGQGLVERYVQNLHSFFLKHPLFVVQIQYSCDNLSLTEWL